MTSGHAGLENKSPSWVQYFYWLLLKVCLELESRKIKHCRFHGIGHQASNLHAAVDEIR